MSTKAQDTIFINLKKAICESVEAIPVDKGAIKITLPFLDWKGYPVFIYVTKEGQVTDGGNTINQLTSLRVIDDFEEWPFKEGFFHRYQIQQTIRSLEPIDSESTDSLLSYIQGITRIPSFFEPRPISSKPDNYPFMAIKIATEGLRERYQLSASEISRYVTSKTIKLKSNLKIQTDMAPNRKNAIVKVVSHASGTTTDKRQHVGYKLYEQGLWKRENSKVQLYTVLGDLGDYPWDSRELLIAESEKIIQTKDPDSKYEIAEMLIEA